MSKTLWQTIKLGLSTLSAILILASSTLAVEVLVTQTRLLRQTEVSQQMQTAWELRRIIKAIKTYLS